MSLIKRISGRNNQRVESEEKKLPFILGQWFLTMDHLLQEEV
jgi:hypothetical protein